MRTATSVLRPKPSLLAQSQSDPDAFGVFYDAYFDRVVHYFVRRTRIPETAFDLAAETFAQALERRHQFRGSNAPQEASWLFAIAHTQLVRYFRSGALEHSALSRLQISLPPLSAAELERLGGELEGELAEAVAALPTRLRQAVRLRILEEHSYADVARALGVTEDAARQRVSRALERLRLTIGSQAT